MSTCTLNGIAATFAEIVLPIYGVWSATIRLTEESELSEGDSAELKLLDLTLRGTITRGGSRLGAGSYRVLGGAAGWRLPCLARPYRKAGGVALSAVLGDAARDVGETIELGAGEERLVGTAEVTEAATGARLLNSLCSNRWYVRRDGVTRIERRPSGSVPAGYQVISVDEAHERAVIATESPASIVPGLSIDIGLSAPLAIALVIHRLEGSKLRTDVCGQSVVNAMKALVRESLPDDTYSLFHPYEVVAMDRNEFDLRSRSVGMPDIRKVRIRPGIPGHSATLAVGSSVLVGFERQDRTKPFIAFYTDPDSSGFRPVTSFLDASSTVRIGQNALSVIAGAGSGFALVKHAELATWAGLVNTALNGLGAPIAALTGAATATFKAS